jgi:N-dimethylarginine dimethylaminohydrolase
MGQWGRHYLMCPPDYFDVAYSINPWMVGEEVDRPRAKDQWATLASAIEAAGGIVETITPQPGLPDMVFTANAGIVSGTRFVPSRMRYRERRDEPALAARWMEARGLDVVEIPHGCFEGSGDALPFGDGPGRRLVAGYGLRSDTAAWDEIAAATGLTITPLPLVDTRLYHIDLVFCPLDERRALVAPIGLTAEGLAEMRRIVPEPILVDDDEALRFVTNSIVVNDTILMPHCSPRIGRLLEQAGLEPVVVDVGEFTKAGGAIRCLTLPLDVDGDFPA